ncbi:MAG: DUF177 domain-containing protein [Rhodospirillales bacterium]|nr:DUF177 domain-containing protein [Rhodospirillales bacterium]
MSNKEQPVPEFSWFFEVDSLKDHGNSYDLSANAEECSALAERYGIQSLQSLEAKITLSPGKEKGTVLLEGTLKAALTQTCVVTLEPLNAAIEATFEILYSAEAEEESLEETFSSEDALPPEPIVDGKIDLGEAVAVQLALEIDPFPRKNDSQIDNLSYGPEGGSNGIEGQGPFAKLAQLKKKS